MLIDWIHGTIRGYNEEDLISKSLTIYGEWAKHEIDFITNYLLKDGDFFLDIGAFIGTHCISIAKKYPAACGIAIEANPKTFNLLNENLKLSCCTNIETINAIVNHVQKIKFGLITQESNRGGTTVDPLQCNRVDGIESITIDSLNLSRLDFIKIDVEGMEREVLTGGRETIKKFRPVILAEFTSLYNHGFILRWCKKLNYNIYGLFCDAFNVNNFKLATQNIFGLARELAIVVTDDLLTPVQYSPERGYGLIEINNLDDLVFLLSCKPQYGVEIAKKHKLAMPVSSSFLSFTDELFRIQNEASAKIAALQEDVKISAESFRIELDQQKKSNLNANLELMDQQKEIKKLELELEDAQNKLAEKELEVANLELDFRNLLQSKTGFALMRLQYIKSRFLRWMQGDH